MTFQDAYEKVGASVLPALHQRLLSQADFSTPCLECTCKVFDRIVPLQFFAFKISPSSSWAISPIWTVAPPVRASWTSWTHGWSIGPSWATPSCRGTVASSGTTVIPVGTSASWTIASRAVWSSIWSSLPPHSWTRRSPVFRGPGCLSPTRRTSTMTSARASRAVGPCLRTVRKSSVRRAGSSKRASGPAGGIFRLPPIRTE